VDLGGINMKKSIALFVLLFSLIFCDPRIDLSVNGTLEEWNISFNCANVNILASTMGGHIFSIYTKYQVGKEFFINTDSLTILFEGNEIPFYHMGSGKKIEQNQIIVNSNREIQIDFEIKNGVRKGEVITILTKGYIYCENKPVELDTLNLSMEKDFY